MHPELQPVAVPVGKLQGRNVYRVPVTVQLNSSRLCTTVARHRMTVLAYGAADAANYARNLYATRAETEIFATGPRGGITKRYVGWESAIAAAMFQRPRVLQFDWVADEFRTVH